MRANFHNALANSLSGNNFSHTRGRPPALISKGLRRIDLTKNIRHFGGAPPALISKGLRLHQGGQQPSR